MKKSMEFYRYVNEEGDFGLPKYLFDVINSLMKQSLDMGTLLSNDQAKTRAYKERIKDLFRTSWLSVAQAFEYFEWIVPCECYDTRNFCQICGGSRYQMNTLLSPDVAREIATITSAKDDPELVLKLQEGLERALKETNNH